MLRKVIRFADAAVSRAVALVCLLLFLICLYAMIDAAHVYMTANDTSVLKYKPKLGEAKVEMPDLTEDYVAWLTVEDTRIDYPLMQGENNSTYLNMDPYGRFSLSGSIFLDSRNSGDFSDPFSLVYGHHMEHGAMFGCLDDFYDRDYFEEHRTGLLMTEAGEDYSIFFFACCKTMGNNWLIFDPVGDKREEILSFLQENAAIYDPEGIDPSCSILALSTCQGGDSLERLILFGVLQNIP